MNIRQYGDESQIDIQFYQKAGVMSNKTKGSDGSAAEAAK